MKREEGERVGGWVGLLTGSVREGVTKALGIHQHLNISTNAMRAGHYLQTTEQGDISFALSHHLIVDQLRNYNFYICLIRDILWIWDSVVQCLPINCRKSKLKILLLRNKTKFILRYF